MAMRIGILDRSVPEVSGQVADQRRSQGAIVARVTGVQHHEDQGCVSDGGDPAPPEEVAEGDGGHQRSDHQGDGAERHGHVDEPGPMILESIDQPADYQADRCAAYRADDGCQYGASAPQPSFGYAQHDQH